jgi:hypothetical protein
MNTSIKAEDIEKLAQELLEKLNKAEHKLHEDFDKVS